MNQVSLSFYFLLLTIIIPRRTDLQSHGRRQKLEKRWRRLRLRSYPQQQRDPSYVYHRLRLFRKLARIGVRARVIVAHLWLLFTKRFCYSNTSRTRKKVWWWMRGPGFDPPNLLLIFYSTHVPSVWAKRKLWDQIRASHNSETATTH